MLHSPVHHIGFSWNSENYWSQEPDWDIYKNKGLTVKWVSWCSEYFTKRTQSKHSINQYFNKNNLLILPVKSSKQNIIQLWYIKKCNWDFGEKKLEDIVYHTIIILSLAASVHTHMDMKSVKKMAKTMGSG